MIVSGLIGILTGLLVGGRFRIFATLPVQALAFGLALLSVVLGNEPLPHALMAFLVFSLSLQAGYVIMASLGAPSAGVSPAKPFNA